MSELLTEWLSNTGPENLFRTCASCFYTGKGAVMCHRFKQIPPIQVVMRGCEAYHDIRLAPPGLDPEVPF